MRGSMKWLGAASLALMVVGFAAPAAAQDTPGAELSAGYQYFSGKGSEDTEWTKFPKGWYADLAGNVGGTIGIVGQVTGSYKTFEDDATFTIHTYMGGIRAGNPGRVRGFGQVLVGIARLKATDDAFGFSETQTNTAFQVGGGVTALGYSNVGLRVGIDYVRFLAKDDFTIDDDSIDGFRFVVGVAIGFGG